MTNHNHHHQKKLWPIKQKDLGVNGGGGGNAEEQGGAVGSEEPATCEAPEKPNLPSEMDVALCCRLLVHCFTIYTIQTDLIC